MCPAFLRCLWTKQVMLTFSPYPISLFSQSGFRHTIVTLPEMPMLIGSFQVSLFAMLLWHLWCRKKGVLSGRQRWWFEYYKTPPGPADIPETYAIKTLYQFNQLSFMVSLYCLKSNFLGFLSHFELPNPSFLLSLTWSHICCNAYVFNGNQFSWNTAVWHMWAMSCLDFHYFKILSFLKSRTHLSASWCLLKM